MARILFGLFLSIFILAACQKVYDPLGQLGTNANTANFTATINGTNWEATGVKTALRTGGFLVLNGASPGKSLVFSLRDSGVHTYTLQSGSATNFNVAAWTDSSLTTPNGISSFTSNSWPTDGVYGTIKVTNIDTVRKTMSGTFDLKLLRQVDSLQRTFTNGKFTNIPYSAQLPPSPVTDTFRVKLNGTPFVPDNVAGVKAFGRISVSGFKGSGFPTVGLSVPDTTTPGTYPFFGLDYLGQYNSNSTTFFTSDSGSVTILEHNTTTRRIRGNFAFRAKNILNNPPDIHRLTEGYFSIRYQ